MSAINSYPTGRLPFLYLIGWTVVNAWYVGVRFARGCHPSDLWTTYFTSSTKVTELRDMVGEPDVVSILATGSEEDVLAWEKALIRDDQLYLNQRWLNRCYGACPSGLMSQINHKRWSDPAYREKMAEARRKLMKSPEWKRAREQAAATSKLRNRNCPQRKAAIERRLSRLHSDKALRAQNSAKAVATMASDEWKLKHSEMIKERHRKIDYKGQKLTTREFSTMTGASYPRVLKLVNSGVVSGAEIMDAMSRK